MAYSTAAQLQANVALIAKTFIDTSLTDFCTDRITLADKIVLADIALCVDTSLLPDDDTTPVVNLLSQYKAAEMSLRRIVGIKGQKSEVGDISEWSRLYSDLMTRICSGSVPVVLADGTKINSSSNTMSVSGGMQNIRPYFGYGEYGEYLTNAELLEVRGDAADTDGVISTDA